MMSVAVATAPPRLWQGALIRECLTPAGSNLHDLTFDHVEAVRRPPQRRQERQDDSSCPDGPRVAGIRSPGVPPRRPTVAPEFNYDLPIPGVVRVPELRPSFPRNVYCRTGGCAKASRGHARVLVDGDALGPYVKIRNWKPGDYYRPAGWPAGKVKKLFQRARVPRSQRGSWPVLVTDSTIVWVTSFPVSREFTPSGRSKKIVAFEALEG